MKLFVQVDSTGQWTDYTQYIVDGSLTIEDGINVPTLTSFSLVASDGRFALPPRGSYIKVVSEIYGATGGYLVPGQLPVTNGKVLSTGFISNEPERSFLGLNKTLNQFGFQQLNYQVNVTSDEWLLNTSMVPFIPAFVDQTQGQILARLAEALCPDFGFDVTSFVASGDIVPYYAYDPQQTWADIAKTFSDASRYRYKVINKTVYFLPFGDQPLGVQYDETGPQKSFFPLDMKTGVLTVPPVNDALVLGASEPQGKWDDYFVGDGFTSNFKLRHTMFHGTSTLLLTDDWTETSFQDTLWTVQDPQGVFSLPGALNVNQLGSPSPLNDTYILGKNGIELGGVLELQAGEFSFTDYNLGIVGGVYSDPANLTLANCICGFQISGGVSAPSGASGVGIFPILNGQILGRLALSQENHHYQLEIRLGSSNWTRYQQAYRTLDGTLQYGGLEQDATTNVTFLVSDIDLGLVIATQYNNLVFNGGIVGPPVAVVPVVTQLTVSGVGLPAFGVYAIINAENLNLALNFTQISQPPQGQLSVASLTGASATQLPVYPPAIAPAGTSPSKILQPALDYSLGFGLSGPTATVSQTGNTSYLSFFSDTIPGVGSRIRFISWANGQAIARVQNQASIANSAKVSGDTGLRSAIFTNLSPQPRTSDECEMAAAATISDRAYPQFQGAYTVFTIPFRYETALNPALTDYPRTGRFLFVNAPYRGMQPEPGSPQSIDPVLVDSGTNGSIFGGDQAAVFQVAQAGDYFFVNARTVAGFVGAPPHFSDTYGGQLQWHIAYQDPLHIMMYARAPIGLPPGSVTVHFAGGPVTTADVVWAHYTGLPASLVAAGASGLPLTKPNLILNGVSIVLDHVYGSDPWYFAAYCIPATGQPTVKSAFTVGQLTAHNAQTNVPPNWQKVGTGPTDMVTISNLQPASGQNLFVTTIRTQIIELREEIIQCELSYGPDQYLEKLLVNFIQRPEPGILGPTESSIPPTPIELQEAGSFYQPMFTSGAVTAIRNSLSGNFIDVNLGQLPVTAAEVRRVDGGWGLNDQNLIGLFTTQTFSLPRTSRDQTWYIRPRNGSFTSRFSYIIRVNVPLIPSAPTLLQADSTQIVLQFNGFVGDIYGLELRATPTSGAQFIEFPPTPEDSLAQLDRFPLPVPVGTASVVNHGNINATYNPASNQNPFPFAEQFQLGDIVFIAAPGDASFGGFQLVTNLLTASGSVGSTPLGNRMAIDKFKAFFFNNNHSFNGAWGYGYPFLTNGTLAPYNVIQGELNLSSLEFNSINGLPAPAFTPMRVAKYDTAGNLLGYDNCPPLTSASNWSMAITGHIVVPAAGTYVLVCYHDDGIQIGIDPSVTVVKDITNPYLIKANTQPNTSLLDLPVTMGNDLSGARAEAWDLTFPAASAYPFEVDYAQWYHGQSLILRSDQGSMYPATFSPPASGSPWGFGWFDYGQPYPDQWGPNITYGQDFSDLGMTVQLVQRGASFQTLSGIIDPGTGVCTINTNSPHGFNVGEQVIVGCSWQTFPASGYPPLPNSGAVFCGVQTVTAVPSPAQFKFVSNALLASIANPSTWAYAAYTQGVPIQSLNGLVAPMPTPFTLPASSGVIIQRPIFSPSDLTIDLTQPDIAETLGILQATSVGGRIQGLTAYFFNLTWDYSFGTPIPQFEVPAITGVFVNDATQQMQWNVASGRPSGYRILVQDPSTLQLLNQYTIDHPFNTQLLLQNQLTPTDFQNTRMITIVPFDAVGDGIPLTILHIGVGFGGGGIPGSLYSIHSTVNGLIRSGQVLLRAPLDCVVQFSNGMLPSQGWIDVPPVSGQMICSIQKFSYADGTQDTGLEFACLIFSSGQHNGAYSGGNELVFPGETVKVIAPTDTTNNGVGIGITLSAVVQPSDTSPPPG